MTVSKKVDKPLDPCCKMKTQEQQRCSSSPNRKPQESGEPAVNILDQKLEIHKKRRAQQEVDGPAWEQGDGDPLLVVVKSLFS